MKNSLEQKEIRRWWNSKRQKRWEKIYKGNTYGALKLNNRMKKILNNVEQINKKKVKILELGFGGGDLAYNLIKKGHEYTGIDISKNLVNAAKKKCKKLKNKKYKFICGSIDKNLAFQSNHFDIVIVCGVMQYITKPLKTFSEIFRVLKKNCYFICVQSNFLMLRNFLNFKSFLNRIICLVLDEKYEVSSSFRSLLLETKLKKFFQGKIKKKIATSKFCNKNYVKVNFTIFLKLIHWILV